MTVSLASAQQTNSSAAITQPAQQHEILNNDGVIQLKQLGLGEGVIVDKIKTSPCQFDLSLNGLKQLKAADISDTIISAMLSAKSDATASSATTSTQTATQSADPNNPESPHDAGIWLYMETGGKPAMTQLEPSVYSQSKSGVAFFMEFGQTVKTKAVIHSAHAELVIMNRQPVFYFYFEHAQTGLSDVRGATSPNEYILAQFQVSEKDNERRLVMGSVNAYSGGVSGAESKSVRSIDFQKLSPGVYKVSPKEILANGEDGFFYGGDATGGKVFDFGVKGSAETEPAPVIESGNQTQKKSGAK
jgi:hypothetical protein